MKQTHPGTPPEPTEDDINLARYMARKMSVGSSLDFSECFSAALFALAKNWQTVKTTGKQRASYLCYKMKWAIMDDIRVYLGRTKPKGSVTSCESDIPDFDLDGRFQEKGKSPDAIATDNEYKEMVKKVSVEDLSTLELVAGKSATEVAKIRGTSLQNVGYRSRKIKSALQKAYPNEVDAPWNPDGIINR